LIFDSLLSFVELCSTL